MIPKGVFIAAGSLTAAHNGSYSITVDAIAGCSANQQFTFNLRVTDCASDILTVDTAGTFFSAPALTYRVGDTPPGTLNWDHNVVTSAIQTYPF